MPRTRTTVMLDEALTNRAQRILRTSSKDLSTSDVIEVALKDLIKRDSLKQLAQTLRTPNSKDEPAPAAQKRRSV